MARKKPLYALLLLTLPTLAVASLALVLMSWRVPTRVRVDLTLDRTAFIVAGEDSAPILNSVGFESITVEKFARIDLSPEKVAVADPAQYSETEDRYPEQAWKSLTVDPPVVITGEDEMLQPAATLLSAKPESRALGKLDRVWARRGSEVTLEIRGRQKQNLAIKVEGIQTNAVLSLREPFQLITDYCLVSGVKGVSYKEDSLSYRTQLPQSSPFVQITSLPGSLVLILTIPSERSTDLFFKGGIPVAALDFTRQTAKGDPETTLVRDGKITYPDYPKVEKVAFKASDFIRLDHLERFRIEEIALDPERKGIRLRLNGIAGHVKTGSQEFPEDHRLSLFDTLWQNPRLIILFSIIVWVFPSTVGAYKFYRELKQ